MVAACGFYRSLLKLSDLIGWRLVMGLLVLNSRVYFRQWSQKQEGIVCSLAQLFCLMSL